MHPYAKRTLEDIRIIYVNESSQTQIKYDEIHLASPRNHKSLEKAKGNYA